MKKWHYRLIAMVLFYIVAIPSSFGNTRLESTFTRCVNPPLTAGLPGLGERDRLNMYYFLPCILMACAKSHGALGCGWYDEMAAKSKVEPVSDLVGSFAADDRLYIFRNGQLVFNGGGIPWATRFFVRVPDVRAGDRITFRNRNFGGRLSFRGQWTWNGQQYYSMPSTFDEYGNSNNVYGPMYIDWDVNAFDDYFPIGEYIGINYCEWCFRDLHWTAPNSGQWLGYFNVDDRFTIFHYPKTGGSSVRFDSPKNWGQTWIARINNVQPGDMVLIRLRNDESGGFATGKMQWNYKNFDMTSELFPTQGIFKASDGGWMDQRFINADLVWKDYMSSNSYRFLRWYAPKELMIGADLARVVQDLKTFIALQQLDYTRDEVVKQVTPPPEDQQNQFVAYKARAMQPWLYYQKQQREWQMLAWDYYARRNYTESSYLYDHFRNYCSFFESGYASTQQYCGDEKMTRPYDMMAETLLNSTVIPETAPEYIYKDGSKYHTVLQDEVSDFTARNPRAELLRSYPKVDRQKAAMAYIKNLTNPIPFTPPPANEFYDDPNRFIYNAGKGIPYLMSQFNFTTQLSLIRESLLRMYTDRLPYKVHRPVNTISAESANTSYLGLLDFESNRRFQDEDWVQEMSKLPYGAMLKDMANMLALENTVTYRMMSQLERIEAMLAVNGAVSIGTIDKEPVRAMGEAQAATGQQ